MKNALRWLAWSTIPVALYLQFFTHALIWQHRLVPAYGALFNATFGNFAKLVIAIFANRAGLIDVVRAYLCLNGETNWYQGVQRLAVYEIIAVAPFFLPMSEPVPQPGH